jgi:hypothetical protein
VPQTYTMKFLFTGILICLSLSLFSQELFVYTEPASNMAAKSVGVRLSNSLMKENSTGKVNYHFIPELMVGVSKSIMIHAQAFLSNRNNTMVAEGGSLYLKYRFYSQDEVHNHFRLAAYTKASMNNSDVHQTAIDLNGHNSGIETGLIATKLVNKVALSAGVTHLYAADNGKGNKFLYGNPNRHAVGYNISLGKLMLPKEYTSYNQTNLNLMLEMLGQTNLQSGKSYIDLAPSVQFIIRSRMRMDLGYRFAVVKDLDRTATQGALLRFEYNLFNAF